MAIWRYKDGQEARIGDVGSWPQVGGGVCEFDVTAVDSHGINIEMGSSKYWKQDPHRATLIRRADGSSPHIAPSPPATDERFAPGAYWESKDSEAFLDVVIESWGARGHRTIFVIEPDGRSPRYENTRTEWNPSYVYRGNIADAVEAFLVALTRAVEPLCITIAGKRVPVVANSSLNYGERYLISKMPTEPETFAVCDQCGERQPGAECEQPACRQVRKHVAARAAEAVPLAMFGKFDAEVRTIVAMENASAVRVVTDCIAPRDGVPHRFFAELSIGGRREALLISPVCPPSKLEALVSGALARLREEMGAKAMGAKR